VLISPEIILSKVFVKEVLRNPDMAPRILSVVVDEAHVVSHWGAGFRKQYGELGTLRAILPKGTPFVAMSATLAPRVRRDVLKKLQFDEKTYVDINIGNDRPNVSIVVRAIQNPMNTCSDLDFVIPDGVKVASDIPKTFIYADQISAEVGLETRLTERLPRELRESGLIRPFSAAFSPEHRQGLLDLFKAGIVRVLICTDAAGMVSALSRDQISFVLMKWQGCNIPDVDVVVQWKLPASMSTFVQRAGRAGRDPKRTGLAVLLVEKSVYEADLTRLDEASSGKKKKSVRQSSTYPKAPKGYALRHGVQRGSFDGLSDENLLKEDVVLDLNSLDEGLYSLVQTGLCRRKVLAAIYGNDTPRE
jgi:superfamily II DNA helicase RecQ